MKKSLIELAKSILIVLLMCSMLLMMVASLPAAQVRQMPWLSRLMQPLASVLGLPGEDLTYLETVLPVMDAASPLAISVRNETGRYTAMWDMELLDDAYEELGGILGQALDTASGPVRMEMSRLTRVLSGVSVWFSYEGKLPAGLLAEWLDASMKEEAETPIGAFVLAVEEDTAALYLVGEEVVRMDTEVNAQTLAFMLSEYYPDGSSFGFEVHEDLPDLHLLPGEGQTISGVSRVRAVTQRKLEQLATDLGFNPYGDTNYTDAAGDTYFTEQGSALRVSHSGMLTLTSTASAKFTAADTQSDTLAEEARRLVELAAGDTLGDARLYLTGLERTAEETVLTFRHVVDGIPVETAEGIGARVTFSGTAVTGMELQLVTYVLREQPQYVLPPVQAAAILPAGGELRLIYRDTGNSVLAGWHMPEEQSRQTQ